jgi:hypothetical protein
LFEKRRWAEDAGAVHEHVDAVEALACSGDDLSGDLRPTCVSGDERGAIAAWVELRLGGLEHLQPAAVQHHSSPLLEEPPCGRFPDSTAAAGDDRDLALKLHVRFSFRTSIYTICIRTET